METIGAFLFAIITFLTAHWVPIVAVLAYLSLQGAAGALESIAKILGVIGQILANQAVRDADAADERSKYPSMDARLDGIASSLERLDGIASSLDAIEQLLTAQDAREESAANARTSDHISRQFLPRS